MRWIKDHEFIRGKCPMTKFEVRLATIGLLNIEKDDVLVDIGAGTGSISIEAALQGAEVFAIEREVEGIWLIRQNAEKFGVSMQIIHNSAPEGLSDIQTFNKCFMGGSGGNLEDIFKLVNQKLQTNGIFAANFVTLNNLYRFQKLLKQYNYHNIEVRMLQTSSVDGKTGILKANNPVFIVKGEKNERNEYRYEGIIRDRDWTGR